MGKIIHGMLTKRDDRHPRSSLEHRSGRNDIYKFVLIAQMTVRPVWEHENRAQFADLLTHLAAFSASAGLGEAMPVINSAWNEF